MFKNVFLVVLILTSHVSAFVKDPIYDDLEGYELVSALIRDGKLDLAEIELGKPNIQNQNSNRYHLLKGQFFFTKGNWGKAIEELKQSKGETLAPIYLGRSYFELKKYNQCAKSYAKSDLLLAGTEADYIKKSDCEFQLKHYAKAFFDLKEGEKKYASFNIKSEIVGLKIKMELFNEALITAQKWLAENKSSPSEYLELVEKFYQIGRMEEALSLLEMGRVQYPTNKDLNLTLSQLFFQKKMLLASEEGFSRAALTDRQYYYHAAEINRQVGKFVRTQYLNSYVQDDKEKLKQKIATFVDTNKYPLIASLESVINRSDLIKDDEIKYALAYSLVKMGQINGPLKYLSSITKPELLEKTTVLRKTLMDCQEKDSSCNF